LCKRGVALYKEIKNTAGDVHDVLADLKKQFNKIVDPTPEQKKLHSELAARNWQNEEYRSIMYNAHIGRKNTEETKEMMSASNKRVWDNRTEEERKQFSDKLKAGWVKRKANKGLTK